MCMCLARDGGGGDGRGVNQRIGFGISNSVGTGGVLDVSLCLGCGGVGGVGGEGVGGLDQCLEGWVVLCMRAV